MIGKDTFKCHFIYTLLYPLPRSVTEFGKKSLLRSPPPSHSNPLNLKWKLWMKLNEKVSSLIHTYISQINKEGKTKNEIYPFYCQFAETKRKTFSINSRIYLYLIFWAGGWLVLTNQNLGAKRMCYLVTSNRTYSRSNPPNTSEIYVQFGFYHHQWKKFKIIQSIIQNRCGINKCLMIFRYFLLPICCLAAWSACAFVSS